MRKTKKRRPDFRRIRPTKTYTVAEIAKTLDRSPATVRNWIRDELPTIDDHNPPFVQGSALKTWLKAKWAARKRSCQLDEIYCFKCRRPRTTRSGSVRVTLRNQKTASIKAKCHACGTRMTRACSLVTKAEIEAGRHRLSPQLKRLAVCSHATTKHTSESNPVKTPSHPDDPVQLSMRLGAETGGESCPRQHPAIRIPEQER